MPPTFPTSQYSQQLLASFDPQDEANDATNIPPSLLNQVTTAKKYNDSIVELRDLLTDVLKAAVAGGETTLEATIAALVAAGGGGGSGFAPVSARVGYHIGVDKSNLLGPPLAAYVADSLFVFPYLVVPGTTDFDEVWANVVSGGTGGEEGRCVAYSHKAGYPDALAFATDPFDLGTAGDHRLTFTSDPQLTAGVYFIGFHTEGSVNFYRGDTTLMVAVDINRMGEEDFTIFSAQVFGFEGSAPFAAGAPATYPTGQANSYNRNKIPMMKVRPSVVA